MISKIFLSVFTYFYIGLRCFIYFSWKSDWHWFYNYHNYQKWPGLLAEPGSCLPGLWPWLHPLSCLVSNHTECFTSNKQIENIHETTDTKEICWFLSLSLFCLVIFLAALAPHLHIITLGTMVGHFGIESVIP